MGLSEPLAVVLLGPESLAPGQGPAAPEAAARPARWASAAGAAAAGAAGTGSASVAAESSPGTPQGTGKSLAAGLLGVLPETDQEQVARMRRCRKDCCRIRFHEQRIAVRKPKVSLLAWPENS